MSFISGIPVVGNAIDSFLHPEAGYKAAGDEMQKAWQQAQQFQQNGLNQSLGIQQPFQTAGTSQLPILNNAENQLLNPSDLLSKWMQSYSMSPFAQTSMSNAKNAGLDAASSMGLMGSSSALKNIQQSSADIMNSDRQQFLNDLMQKYMTGIGIGQNIYGIGGQTAGNMGNNVTSTMGNLGKEALGVGENLGQAAYGVHNAPGDRIMNIGAMLAKMYMQGQNPATAAA